MKAIFAVLVLLVVYGELVASIAGMLEPAYVEVIASGAGR